MKNEENDPCPHANKEYEIWRSKIICPRTRSRYRAGQGLQLRCVLMPNLTLFPPNTRAQGTRFLEQTETLADWVVGSDRKSGLNP